MAQSASISQVEPVRLSGNWQVYPVPLDSIGIALPPQDYLSVPECSHLQPILCPDRPYWGEHLRSINQRAWIYRRIFTVPDVPYRRARLRFDGVDYFAEVWVNEHFVGLHEGHFAPFHMDVTAFLQPGAENELIVRVSAPWDKPNLGGTYPMDHVIRGLVKGLYEHGEGVIPPHVNPIGIWRPVWLLLDDGISIDQVRIHTKTNGQVDLQITCSNTTADIWEGSLDLKAEAENHDGSGAHMSDDIQLLPGTHSMNCQLSIPDPHLWWPWDHGCPDLYHLEAELSDHRDHLWSNRRENFGVRTVRLERSAERFTYWINDRTVFVRGTSYIPGLYLSQCSGESLAHDIALAQKANLNLLRAHVHVSPPEFYDQCDRTGMMVWQDFELSWVQDTSAEFEARARTMQREMMNLLGNHASIVSWACHNEPTMIFTRRHNLEQRPDPALYADAIQYDPTRPVFICSGQLEADWLRAGDTHSYYGALWSDNYTDIYRHRFRLNTEFGFEAPAALSTLRAHPAVWSRLGHLEGQVDELWDYQARLIQFQVEHLRRLRADSCGGYIHFWLVDLVPQVGCGVLDSERKPKGGYDALSLASQPLLIALEHDGRRPRALWIFNDTPQSYLGAQISLRIYDETRQLLFQDQFSWDITANGSERVVAADWPILPSRCARIELSLYGANGALLSENYYQNPFQPPRRPRGYPWKFDPYLGTKVFDRPDAPSLADQNVNPILKLVPQAMREMIAEWALRQQLPIWLVSTIARVVDRVMM
jgi:beta-mannosidase